MNVARDSFAGYATDDALRQVDDAVELALQRRERFAAAERRIDELVVTEESPDGAARATVRSSGALVSLELSDRVRTMPPRQLASLVQTCVQRAQAGVAQRVGDILNEAAPGDPLTEELVANARKALMPGIPVAPPAPASPARARRNAPRTARRDDHRNDHADDWDGRSVMVRADGRR